MVLEHRAFIAHSFVVKSVDKCLLYDEDWELSDSCALESVFFVYIFTSKYFHVEYFCIWSHAHLVRARWLIQLHLWSLVLVNWEFMGFSGRIVGFWIIYAWLTCASACISLYLDVFTPRPMVTSFTSRLVSNIECDWLRYGSCNQSGYTISKDFFILVRNEMGGAIVIFMGNELTDGFWLSEKLWSPTLGLILGAFQTKIRRSKTPQVPLTPQFALKTP